MDLLGRKKLVRFMRKHADARIWLQVWIAEVEEARWSSPADVKARYRSASVLDGGTVVFNVKGNRYRMEVQIAFRTQKILVKRIGTHEEYTRWG